MLRTPPQGKRVAVNLVALFGAHAGHVLLPLLAFPYLLAILGPTSYSHVVVTESISLLVLIIALYSFDVDGVRKVVGLHTPEDAEIISRIFSRVLTIRLLLLAMAGSVTLIATHLIAPHYLTLLLAWLLLPLAVVLQSAWMFNGLERNSPMAAAVVIARGAALISIFVYMGPDSSPHVFPLAIGISACVASIALLAYARIAWGIRWHTPTTREVREELREGVPIFLGGASVFLYRDFNVIILNAVAGPTAVAAYSIAEKLVKGLQSIARPLNQLAFPIAIKRLADETSPNKVSGAKLRTATLPQMLIVTGLWLGIAITWGLAGDTIISKLNIPSLADAAILVAIMAPATLFGIANYMFGSVGLNHLGERYYLFKSTLVVGLSNVLVCWAAAHLFAARGAAAAFLLSEALLLAAIMKRYLGSRHTGVRV